MEKHGKLSQNDVDQADTAVVCDKREIMIWIFGEIAKFQIAERRLSQNKPLFS